MKEQLRSIFTENLGYKLFSLVVATVFWLNQAGDNGVVTSISVPIQYRNLPKDLEINSDVRDEVHVEVRGPSRKVTPTGLADVLVLLDLQTVNRPGDRTFPVAGNLTLPTGVELERAVPAQVRLHFERRLTREVPVTVRIGAQPPSGYAVVSQRAEPAAVRIIGPESRVRDIATAETDPIDLSDTVRTEEFPVHAYVTDPQVRVEGTGRVVVRVEVAKP